MANSFSPSANAWLTGKSAPAGQSSIQTSQPANISSFSSSARGWLTQAPAPVAKAPIPVSPNSPKVAKAPIKENPIQSVLRDTVNRFGEVHFADKMNAFTPLGFAANVAQGIINTPKEALKGGLSLYEHNQAGTSTPQQQAGDIAAAIQLPLLFLTGGESAVAKQGLKQAVKMTAKTTLKQATQTIAKDSIIGGAFGLLGGLQSGKEIKNTKEYINNLLVNTESGALLGAGASSVLHLGSTVTEALMKGVALPLAKGLSSKFGSVFVKTPKKGADPIIDHIQLEPHAAQTMVLGNQELAKTPAGKAILKTSIEAGQTGQHVGITPHENGTYTMPDGRKVDIYPIDHYNPTKNIDVLNANVDEYRRFGGRTAADSTETKNAALRDIAGVMDQKDVVAHTQKQVQEAIGKGELKKDANGDITLYRGGKPSDKNGIVSASYDKSVAEQFIKEGESVQEFKVKPEDIKTFIGKAEGEVLVKKESLEPKPVVAPVKLPDAKKPNVETKTEETPKINREFDKNGKEIKGKKYQKVLSNNETKAVRDVIESKLNHIRSTTTDPKEYAKEIDKLVADITDRSKGDKTVLSALRTEINKEMFGIAGVGGNYKEAYAALMDIREHDPEMAPLIDNLLTHRDKLDEVLLSKPKPTSQLPADVKITPKKQESFAGNQQPVGTGKPNESRAYERLKEQLATDNPELYDQLKDKPDLLYNRVNQEYDFENAAKLVEKDPQKAYNIAKGLEAPPVGQRQESVSIVLADRALKEGNIPKWLELEQSRSLRQTRRGQEIVAERGRFNESSPHVFVQKLLDSRLTKLGESVMTQIKDELPGKTMTAKKVAIEKIDREVKKVKEILTKEQRKINTFQSIMDEITCK